MAETGSNQSGQPLPPRSPNGNAHLERWHRSVKEECLSKMILFPTPSDRVGEREGRVCTRERLGALPKFYHRDAA